MIRWVLQLDITTVPDEVLLKESARRLRARQVVAPRAKVLRQCPHCLQPFGAREIRKHTPVCEKRDTPPNSRRAGWTLAKVTDAEKQDERTYLYWQSLPVGDRIVATWELTEAAYAIQRVD